ncbi:FtsQ-type POTRA domain-containing protein [Streptacidiphilus sp. PB12-B1b]|uniref:cell division protein FtsQ/DivIB n=1 Tax=Streptacidiphilus sp. PB12-B1b TaxID=2705012 RepID=UPI0015F91F8C|nr:FtsQ-type POTRA domain-containing protein [Streptacidiphilus sp. PB12-B1b]QMU75913.1 FtsQ-type POTRA domain-containing protein [Streptacidiphilus sp. PB12-B1b]
MPDRTRPARSAPVSADRPADRPAARDAAGPGGRLRLSRRGFAVLGALVAGLLGTVCWLVYFSSVLDVRTVLVSGTRVLTRAQVLAAAEVPLGGPLERLDTGAVQARVVSRLPRAARVQVSTSLPHTVRVRITERVAVAAVRGADGRYTLVDLAGVRFATGPTPPPGVPVVELSLSPAGRAALADFPESELVDSAVQIAKALPPSVARATSAVVVHSYDDMELQLAGGATVLWGSPERDARKAVVLAALLKQKAGGYDVSAPDDPALRG